MPSTFCEFLTFIARVSAQRINSRADIGQPCRTLNADLIYPGMITGGEMNEKASLCNSHTVSHWFYLVEFSSV